MCRAAVATALAGLCFLGGGEMAEVVATMEVQPDGGREIVGIMGIMGYCRILGDSYSK